MNLDFQNPTAYFLHLGLILAQSLVPRGKKRLLACLNCTNNDKNWVIVNSRPKHWVKWQEMGEIAFQRAKMHNGNLVVKKV